MAAEREGLPSAIVEAAGDRRRGATEIARRALAGLLEIAGDRELLAVAATALVEGQPAMAPIWHLANAARSDDPATALADLRERLDREATAAVEVAVAWLRNWRRRRPGAVATVSHSSLVDAVLERLGPQAAAAAAAGLNQGAAPGRGRGGEPGVALVGADAIGPKALLNAAGTRLLAARVPTLVVSTPLKLVPASVFARLAAPGFEAVPLDLVTAVALGPELLSPEAAGRRAAALRGPQRRGSTRSSSP
jgi:hypothetical protein